MRSLVPLLLLSAAACTPTAADLDRQAAADAGTRAALDRELAGLRPGQPQDCVNQVQLRDMRSFGDTLVYRGPGRVRYVNRTSGGCDPESHDAYLVTSTPSTQLCRGDIAHAVNRTSGFPVGACSYGDFVPYGPAAR